VSVFAFLAVATVAYGEFRHGREDDATPEYATAEGLQKLGFAAGTKVGVMRFDKDAHWAYLAKKSVVAEIDANEECAFWSASPSVRSDVLRAFARAGASVSVANAEEAITSTSGSSALTLKNCARPHDGWRRLRRQSQSCIHSEVNPAHDRDRAVEVYFEVSTVIT
jgi:hypothetical protein